ncbi:uncharacterized protein LOC128203246 isoform X1 [Mya arenaria]|uniref:uncharacterized protein LOC128203246 isoform X1 n=1 Tax=Mya arenaria TaxID=6604 RepID=UPI0022E0B2E0|nr:uncharacterized protein LOC128203246 isoform X1 [Mya arenaria]
MTLLCFILITCCGLSVVNGDEVAEKAVREYRELCPLTTLCPSRSKTTPTPTTTRTSGIHFKPLRHNIAPPEWPGGSYACCLDCSCDSNCGHDCCPNVLEDFMSPAEVEATRQWQCVHTQYTKSKNDYINIDNSFILVGQCPSRVKNQDVKKKCLQKYDEYDFAEGPQYFVPVSSRFRTYRNRYCAECQGETDGDLIPWSMHLRCEYGNAFLNRFTDIPSLLDERTDCYIFFQPPEDLTAGLEHCPIYTNRCNVTGRWTTYDPDIEAACLSYRSIYFNYNNVHCYLCNGGDASNVSPYCYDRGQGIYRAPKYSFISLLDFNDLEKSLKAEGVMVPDENCDHGYIQDPSEGGCRRISCAKGQILVKDGTNIRCEVPLKTAVDSFAVTFHLSYVLTMKKDFNSFNPPHYHKLQTVALEDVYTKLEFLPFRISGFNLYMFTQLNTSVDELLGVLNKTDDEDIWPHVKQTYVSVSLQVETNPTISEVGEMLHDMAQVFTASDDLYLVFDMQYTTALDFGQISYNTISRNHMDVLSIPLWIKSGIENSFADEHGNDILLFKQGDNYGYQQPFSSLEVEVWPNPTCPRINLLSDETQENTIEVLLSTYNEENTYEKRGLVCYDDFIKYKFGTPVKPSYPSSDQNALAWITVISMSCSIISLVVTIAVYMSVPTMRHLPGLNNIALSACLILFYVFAMMSFVNFDISLIACQVLGAALHFSFLASIFWMLTCTFHFTLMVTSDISFSVSLSIKKQFLRYIVFVLTAASVVVLIHISISYMTLDDNSLGYGGQPCFIAKPFLILYTAAIPLGFIIVMNIAMLVYALYTISKHSSVKPHSTRRNISTLKIFVKLSSLTGIAWLFGYIYQLTHETVVAYLFVILTACQGIFMMVSFVLNRRVFKSVYESNFSSTEMSTRPIA